MKGPYNVKQNKRKKLKTCDSLFSSLESHAPMFAIVQLVVVTAKHLSQ